MSHHHSNNIDSHSDSQSNGVIEWPPECIKCGVGPNGSDCALLNGFCELFTKNDESWRNYIRKPDGSKYEGELND